MNVIEKNPGGPKAPKNTRNIFMDTPLVSVNRLGRIKVRPYLVKNLLLFGQVSILAGPPNTGKTSVIASIAAHSAAGEALGGRQVSKCATLYVAAEDPQGVAERGAAILKRQQSRRKLPFDILDRAVDLTDRDQMDWFTQEIRQYMKRRRLRRLFIVFDTLNLCIGDGDENSARDMGRAVSNAQRLARSCNAHVLIVHHSTASEPGRPRGSTAMIGNTDSLLILADGASEEGRQFIVVKQEKQRSMRKGEPVMFELQAVEVGQDTDGDPITLPMAVPTTDASPADLVQQSKTRNGVRAERAQHLMAVLTTLGKDGQEGFHPIADVRSRLAGPFDTVKSNPDSLRKAMKTATDDLIREGKVLRGPDGDLRIKT